MNALSTHELCRCRTSQSPCREPIGVVRRPGSESSDSGASGAGIGLFETNKSSPPCGRRALVCFSWVIKLNDASIRQVSHSKEDRTSLCQIYFYKSWKDGRPFLFLAHIFLFQSIFLPIHPHHKNISHNGHHTTHHQRQARRCQWH